MPGKGLALLSCDGGGVRGLSSLHILKQLMERIADERQLDSPPKPCEFFDMIGGTSTGGQACLIAIMLGRLEMSIDECINTYIQLSSKVFRRDRLLPFHLGLGGTSGTVAARFDSHELEESVKLILQEKGLDRDALLKSSETGESCKVFVCATDATTRSTRLMTTYKSRRADSDRLKYLQIWQAALATSAASTFFDPIEMTVGPSTEVYVDGATGANNPVRILWNEARDLLVEAGQKLEDHLDCIVSIGTGVPAVEAFGESLKEVGATLVAWSTETENTAAAFSQDHRDLVQDGRYCRFNVQNGLQRVGLEEYQKNDYIASVTKDYLDSPEVMDRLQNFVSRAALRESDGNSQERATLQVALRQYPATQREYHFPSVSAHDQSKVHLGDVYNVTYREPEKVPTLGCRFGSAPLIDPAFFIGRSAALDNMQDILRPGEASTEQRRLVLGGIGGIGKTQLAIAYARRHQQEYTSVLWLNATSELTLKAGFRSVMQGISKAEELERLSDEQVLVRAHGWLCHPENTSWLIIFDNYDEPEDFVIDSYCPHAGHGSVIITTRLPELVRGQHVRVQPLQHIDESLDILQARSQRQGVKDDADAKRLAERLGGFPLALVTAGAYLSKTTITFQEYLEAYNQRWNLHPRRRLRLQEYQDRTLYTTWNLTYRRLENDDPDAARVLQLLAYFDNQEIWYKLLHAGLANGLANGLPTSLQESLEDQINFVNVMRTLVEYCLVEVQAATQSYSMHSCVHDWTLGELNRVIDPQLYWYTFDCVIASIEQGDWESLGQVRYGRLSRHGVRLTHHRFEKIHNLGKGLLAHLDAILSVALLLQQQGELSAAEQMYERALPEKEKALGPEHPSILRTVHNLGNLYADQGKLGEAEQMYERALAGYEKALGPEHPSTLNTVNNLGLLCADQGKLGEAEQMYERALAGNEKALGPEHPSTLDTVNNLGNLYADQGKLREAEQMYARAVAGNEKALGPEHPSTLNTVHNLGRLYADQGKLGEAEQMYARALAGYEKALGPERPSTLKTVHNLGSLYRDQGKLGEAEQMYARALAGSEKALGPEHPSILDTVNNLGILYVDQGKLGEAEQMYARAVAGYEKALGPEHPSTLRTVHNLGVLYADQGKLREAEQMYERALAGNEKALGPEHPSTLDTVNNLGNLYADQGKLGEAEQMYARALAGNEKALGPEHPSTLDTVHNLGSLYRDQDKLGEAEQMYERALAGYEKALRPEHPSTLRTVNNLGRLYRDQGKLGEAEQMYARALVGDQSAVRL